jgi:hypothetical protein
MNTTGSLGIDAQKVEDVAASTVSALTGVSAGTVEHAADHAIAEADKKVTTLLDSAPHLHFDILQLAHQVVAQSQETFYTAEARVKAVLRAAEAFIEHLEAKAKNTGGFGFL